MFCFHKYGKVEEDGRQYCSKCNKAIVAPCVHDWEQWKEYERRSRITNEVLSHALIFKCSKCGTLKTEEVVV